MLADPRHDAGDSAQPANRLVARDDGGGGRSSPDDLHVDAGREWGVGPKRLPVRADVVVLKVTTLPVRCCSTGRSDRRAARA